MPTIPIFLRESQYEKLRDLAKMRKCSVAAIVREAVDMYLKHVPTGTRAHLKAINVNELRREIWRESEESIEE